MEGLQKELIGERERLQHELSEPPYAKFYSVSAGLLFALFEEAAGARLRLPPLPEGYVPEVVTQMMTVECSGWGVGGGSGPSPSAEPPQTEQSTERA